MSEAVALATAGTSSSMLSSHVAGGTSSNVPSTSTSRGDSTLSTTSGGVRSRISTVRS